MIEAVISGLDVVYATSDDRGCSKPPVEAFEVALRISSAKPAQAAVIGDSVYDARDSVYDAKAAKRAAIITVGVLCGGTPKYLLREAGCTAVYRDPPICCRETVLRLAHRTENQPSDTRDKSLCGEAEVPQAAEYIQRVFTAGRYMDNCQSLL